MEDHPREESALRAAQGRMTAVNLERVEAQRLSILEKLGSIPLLRDALADVKVVMNLLRDYWAGEYRDVPAWAIGALAFALLYFINPIELIPEFVPAVGYLDDVILLLLAIRLAREHIEKYKAWLASRDLEP